MVDSRRPHSAPAEHRRDALSRRIEALRELLLDAHDRLVQQHDTIAGYDAELVNQRLAQQAAAAYLQHEIAVQHDIVEARNRDLDFTRAQIGHLEGLLGSRDAAVEFLRGEVSKYEHAVEPLREKVAHLESVLANRDEAIRFLQAGAALLEQAVEPLHAQIAHLKGVIASHEAAIEFLRSEIATHRQTNVEQVAERAHLEEIVAQRDAGIAYLQDEVGERDAEIAQLRAELDRRESEVARLRTDHARQYEDLVRLHADIAQLESMVKNRDEALASWQAQTADRAT